MENIQEKSIFDDFTINEESKSNIGEIAQWSNINAIVGFVSLGISIISTFVTISKASKYGSSATTAAAGGGIFGLIITIALSLLLNLTLLQAATNLKKGVTQTDQGYFGLGLTKLATYFRILGVLTIIVLAIVVLVILIAVIFGIAKGI